MTAPDIDTYIAGFPPATQKVLQRIRAAIHQAVPGTGEKISYQIAAITYRDRNLIYFAGWKEHVSVYPIPPLDDDLARELEPYRAAKGTLRFPLAKPIPYDLIGRVAVAWRESRWPD